VTGDLLADLEVVNPFDFLVEPYAEKWPFEFAANLKEDLSAYLDPEPAGPLPQTLINSTSREPRNTADFLVELNQCIQSIVKYIVRLETGVPTPEEKRVSGFGSCRDSACPGGYIRTARLETPGRTAPRV
jgi:transglutaminase-like putative cysteine protease